jgi:hypothetical protein
MTCLRMNKPDHISESLETIFRIKIRYFFDGDPGLGMEKIRIRNKHPGSATLPEEKLLTSPIFSASMERTLAKVVRTSTGNSWLLPSFLYQEYT